MFVKQRRTHSWSSYLPGKNIFIPQQKSSKLYINMFEVSENVSDYLFMHTAATCVHKCFKREGHLKSAKNDCLSNSVENIGWSSYLLVALTELRKNVITYIVPRYNTQNLIFAWKIHKKLGLHKKTMKNFTCTWPEHSAIVSSWTLKWNASADVDVAEIMWISQNMLWLPCSNRMSRW